MSTPDQPHAQTQEALPHTPLPWVVFLGSIQNRSDDFKEIIQICDPTSGKRYFRGFGGTEVSKTLPVDECEANAKLIVHCVNQHASLTARAALCDELAQAWEQGWLVWSHEHGAWWRPNHCGYTHFEEAAGRYSLKEATQICENARSPRKDNCPNEVMVPSPELLAKHAALAQKGRET